MSRYIENNEVAVESALPACEDGEDSAIWLGSRLAQESLAEAIAQLERTLEASRVADPWYAQLGAATRASMLAIEHCLDAVEVTGGMRDGLRRSEPGLLPRLEQLEGALSRALVECWEAKEASSQSQAGLARRIELLIADLRAIAEREFDIVHATLNTVGGEG